MGSQLTFAKLAEVTAEVGSTDGAGELTRQFNAALIQAFRGNGGRIPGELGSAQILLLTTRGAATGVKRTVPVVYLAIDRRLVVIASMGGAARHPPWYHNVRVNPRVTVELGPDMFHATAVLMTGDDRARLFAHAVRLMPAFADFQARTTRLLPVVELKRD